MNPWLLGAGLFFLFLFSLSLIPIRFALDSRTRQGAISWAGLVFTLTWQGEFLLQELRCFGLKLWSEAQPIKLPKKKPKAPPEPKPPKAQEPTKKPKKAAQRDLNNWEKAQLLFSHPFLPRVLACLGRLLKRLLAAFRFTGLEGQIALPDPYQQGLVSAALAVLPLPKRFRLVSAYQGESHCKASARLDSWKIILALCLFLATFPYTKAFRLYWALR